MKLPGLLFKRGTRRGWVLLAGIGTAGAMTLAPVAVGVSGATQPPTAPPATMTTTVVTNGAWTSTGVSVLVECPYSTYTTIAGATWIWAHYAATNTGCRPTNNGPPTAPAGTVTLKTTFTVPVTPVDATLTVAADNGAQVEINTDVVAALTPNATPTNFDVPHNFTVTATDFRPGSNTITIIGTNVSYTGYNPAGVIAKLAVTWSLTTKNLCKDTRWKQGTTPTFVNQGDCVSYVVSHGNDPANG